MRILIVDDDRFCAQLLAERLQDRKIDSMGVHSAQEALAVDAKRYDGAIIDVMLPNDPSVTGISPEESRGGFWTGISIAKRLVEKNSSLRIVLISSDTTNASARSWASERSIPFIFKGDGYGPVIQALNQLGLLGERLTPRAFIVHGHDSTALLELKNYIQNTLKWQEPIVLREQPSCGKTIIEKFEEYAHGVDCVFVLLTPDDKVVSSGSDDEKRRSRQNVVFELGFFYGRFGRNSGRVFMLHKGPVELPSDTAGIMWIDIERGITAAGEEIRREIAALLPS
jgi:CheY-like chemotaxis protein